MRRINAAIPLPVGFILLLLVTSCGRNVGPIRTQGEQKTSSTTTITTTTMSSQNTSAWFSAWVGQEGTIRKWENNYPNSPLFIMPCWDMHRIYLEKHIDAGVMGSGGLAQQVNCTPPYSSVENQLLPPLVIPDNVSNITQNPKTWWKTYFELQTWASKLKIDY
ncbi:MAG: hypothetical protein M0T78_05620 [Actinomycetota bacterium]|nr:hypothetical protein [Actinomycetota bacterium]